MSKSDDLRAFLRQHLGEDWELQLRAANATAGPDFTDAEVYAARQRAIALVRDRSAVWTNAMSERAAKAWLNSQPVSPRVARGLRRLDRRRSRRVARWST